MDKYFLVYIIMPCEQGTEGWSGWSDYQLVKANNEDEAAQQWCNKMNDNSEYTYTIEKRNGVWYTWYYQLGFIKLPNEVYGNAEPLTLNINYGKHSY